MTARRIIIGIAGICGLGALALGLTIWIDHVDLVTLHVFFGLAVVLILIGLGITAVRTRGMRLLGSVSIVYALVVPILGRTQQMLLPGNLHWLIRTVHMLVGLGALAMIGTISMRYAQSQARFHEAKSIQNESE